eukprot:TRINITY_DN8913_c0_g2_i1.p1 TRINITY_DN8913_c0_g2~~TRINITY_DN8913_c0_g2_i1.p1  ORF type:complete len:779 (+),score=266.11 TRINITY_DN8913_c0_g2_i1:138-2474(+)
MEINVRIEGPSPETLKFTEFDGYRRTMTVGELRALVHARKPELPQKCRLIFRGRSLEDDKPLYGEYLVGTGATIQLYKTAARPAAETPDEPEPLVDFEARALKAEFDPTVGFVCRSEVGELLDCSDRYYNIDAQLDDLFDVDLAHWTEPTAPADPTPPGKGRGRKRKPQTSPAAPAGSVTLVFEWQSDGPKLSEELDWDLKHLTVVRLIPDRFRPAQGAFQPVPTTVLSVSLNKSPRRVVLAVSPDDINKSIEFDPTAASVGSQGPSVRLGDVDVACNAGTSVYLSLGQLHPKDSSVCIECKQPDNGDVLMCDFPVGYDKCDNHCHFTCAGFTGPDDPNIPAADWYCSKCKKKKPAKKARRSDTTTKKNWDKGMGTSGIRKRTSVVPVDHVGEIPGIPVGYWYPYRINAAEDGLHKDHMSGISWFTSGTCNAIVSSGGYEDQDTGDTLVYCGQGGINRDPEKNIRNGPVTQDQELVRGNWALALSCMAHRDECKACKAARKGAQFPTARGQMCAGCKKVLHKGPAIRVIRGTPTAKKNRTEMSPAWGFRYDGLAQCVDWWMETNQDKTANVFKFLIKRMPNQDPAPWTPQGKPAAARLYQECLVRFADDVAKKQAAMANKGKKAKQAQPADDPDAQQADSAEVDEPVAPVPAAAYSVPPDVLALIESDGLHAIKWNEALSKLRNERLSHAQFLDTVQQEFRCVVCLDDFKRVLSHPCGHVICPDCFKKSQPSSCLVCKQALPASNKAVEDSTLMRILHRLFPTAQYVAEPATATRKRR